MEEQIEQPTPSDRKIAEQLADNIRQTWATEVLRERRPAQPHKHVYAGGWRACDRRMYYDCTAPAEAMPFSADTLANFRRGTDRGRELLIDLTQLGRAANPQFEIFGAEERFELKGRNGQTVIVGKTDCSIKQGRLVARVEFKNWNPNLTAGIHTFSDLFDNKWTKAGAYQLLAYLYASNQPIGFMILDRPGLPKILPVVLYEHLDEIEHFLSRAEAVVAHQANSTIPDFHDDPAECKRCPFFGYCNPPLSFEAAKVFADEDFIQLLEERESVEEAAKRYGKLDKAAKSYLRGIEEGIAGPYYISGKWGKLTTYDLPDAIKDRYRVTDPKGKFTVSITRVDSPVKLDEGAE